MACAGFSSGPDLTCNPSPCLDGSFRSRALQPLTYLGCGFVPPDLSQDFILAERKLVSRIRNGEGKLIYRRAHPR
jgi:hypothetical protein